MYICCVLKTYKYRIYPTTPQKELLSKHFGCARFMYNWGLNVKIKAWQQQKKTLTCLDLLYMLKDLKEEYIWLKDVNSQSLQMPLRNLDNAYTRFFREKKGFPKYKTKHGKQSFQCPQRCSVDFNKGVLYIPKFREGLKTVFHRVFDGNIKTITISKNSSGKYFASILIDAPVQIPKKPKINQTKAIGIDLGIKSFVVCSNGFTVDNPKYLKRSSKRLRKLQKDLCRKQKKSNNRDKARIKLAIQHEKVANQRNDFLHKLSHELTHDNQVETICLETLCVSNMEKNHKLAKAINDCSWANFVSFIEYKADWYGKNIIRIGRFEPSSKMCDCGYINKELTLKDREWTCASCGVLNLRDILASKNILKFAFNPQNLIGQGLSKYTPAEKALPSLKQEIVL